MRVEGKGRIDRSTPLTFQFDGRSFTGFAGDTVASALLANDERLVGRSFKYHRPRGIVTQGAEEPNALVTIKRGLAQTPNVRATTQPLYNGLVAHSQNAFPSLKFDAMAINDRLSAFLGAGFYYKTFMWPRALWERVYEPFIRRAAGLGALDHTYDGERYEKANCHCDVLVIGGGPAGLMAAHVAALSGLDVIIADDAVRFGGRLLNDQAQIDGKCGAQWAVQMIEQLGQMPNVTVMPRTTVTGAYDGGVYGALQRQSDHLAEPSSDLPVETFWRIACDRAILCAGALERHIAFPDNDRPGVMMAGAVRGYLNQYGVAAGQKTIVFANNDDAHKTAHDLHTAGIDVTVLDTRENRKGTTPFSVIAGAEVIGTSGRLGLKSVTFRHEGKTKTVGCDCLAVSGGWNPTVHLTCHMNGRPTWNDEISSFVPTPNSVPGLIAAGAANGTFSTSKILGEAASIANQVVSELGKSPVAIDIPDAEDEPTIVSPKWEVHGIGRAWLDFQNDVTTKDVRQAAQENFRSVEHMKRYTTQGMATDQGKSSNVLALAVLADATGRGIPQTGTTTFRPPYTPVSLAALGAGAHGMGFAPQRKLTSHQTSQDLQAPNIEAGLWYRPSYYPQNGERTWRDSCDREVAMVRNAVGVCDVSTLGKIDVKGPDAAAFLDFVYTNKMSTLGEGRVRYGLMLREDGFVLDDGTCARLGLNHFLMTTTTAAAGQVMRHLEFVHQCLRPDFDLSFSSVTEHWAQFAVAGPSSRDLLNCILDRSIGDKDLKYMGCRDIAVAGVAGRLFRISFSGEHAYEIAVPARFGASLFDLLLEQADRLKGGPYGLEALNVLRIEKGFITHAEIDGRVTANDLGLARMISDEKDCIGKTMSNRPGLNGPHRLQLVGLKPAGAVKQIVAGAHMFTEGDAINRVNDQGHISSVGYSPTLEVNLGLGMLKNGRARIGEIVNMVDHLSGVRAALEVCDPVFFDPEGGRLRG